MTRVVFHLFNLEELIGMRHSTEQGQAIWHVDLAAGGWKTEVKSLHSTRDSIKALKAQGGTG